MMQFFPDHLFIRWFTEFLVTTCRDPLFLFPEPLTGKRDWGLLNPDLPILILADSDITLRMIFKYFSSLCAMSAP